MGHSKTTFDQTVQAAEPFFFKTGDYGFRIYDPDRDEEAVCRLCWDNALPGGRPFPLIPETGAVSFGRIVTGAFARHAGDYFYVVEELTTGRLVGYLTGADGRPVHTDEGILSWMEWRDRTAGEIAEQEFGEISVQLYQPIRGYLEGRKILYTLSLGPRAIKFLLHAKFNQAKEMPKAPPCPEYHFHLAEGHRGQGIGRKLIEHFLNQLPHKRFCKVCAQVTVCEGHRSLDYYRRLTCRSKKVWSIYDKKETAMYSATEKKTFGLGKKVENLSLVTDRELLLQFVTQD